MSKRLHNLADAEKFLLEYSDIKPAGQTYTLQRMRILMEYLGNPQNEIKAVHVAGTSGKTSTAYYVRAFLQAAGKKTGLTASPHISSIAERVQVNGEPLPEDTFLKYLNQFVAILEKRNDLRPTYFELLIAFAFWVFKKESVEYMVVEVGLGGLLDATNVISSGDKICVITPIGLDHTEILGASISAIATQKAGIIQSSNQVVFSAEQDEAARQVIDHEASSVTIVRQDIDRDSNVPFFQQANFALARAVFDFIARRDGFESVRPSNLEAVIEATPPGRFEVYNINAKTVIIDGAHNPQKLAALNGSLRARYHEPIRWVLGFVQSPASKIESCIEQVALPEDTYSFTEFTIGQDSKRRQSETAVGLVERAIGKGLRAAAVQDPITALNDALNAKERIVVVSGSLYLVAELRPLIMKLAK